MTIVGARAGMRTLSGGQIIFEFIQSQSGMQIRARAWSGEGGRAMEGRIGGWLLESGWISNTHSCNDRDTVLNSM